MKLFVLTLTFFMWSIFMVKGQEQRCYNPYNQIGFCVTLPKCPSLIQLYGQNAGNREFINFLLGSQRSCGSRSINRDPIVCCINPTSSNIQLPPAARPTTTTATTTTTTPAPSTTDSSCTGPDFRPGTCMNIKECSEIFTDFAQKSSDPEYGVYIRSSNAICKYAALQVCCPEGLSSLDGSIKSIIEKPRLLTVDEGCGFSNVTHTRVVGGVPAALGGWPWMALIGYADDVSNTIDFKCGGSLITSQHVLTATHCVIKSIKNVRLGEHDLSTPSETKSIDIDIAKVIAHPQYTKRDGRNDIAVLILRNSVEFSFTIRPVCLPISEPIRSKSFVDFQPFVTGWGRTQEGGKSANLLQELQIPILRNEVCKEKYKNIGKLISDQQFDEDKVICAGVLAGGKDSCQGDSGGPLVIGQIINGQPIHFQIGVVSYGIGCARAEVPGVYTKVASFIDWIEEQIQTNKI